MPPTIRDADTWVKSTFAITIGEEFETYREKIAYSLADEQFGNVSEPKLQSEIDDLLNNTRPGRDTALPVYYTRKKSRDTSLGGNDAINPFYAFNEDDDPFYESTTSEFGPTGLGRSYSEMYDDTQQVLYMTFGIPYYNTVTSFYGSAIKATQADLMNKGAPKNDNDLLDLIGSSVRLFVQIPAIPFVFLQRLLGDPGKTRITKYYDLQNTMPLYYRVVNSILVELAINVNMANDGLLFGRERSSDTSPTGSPVSDKTQTELFEDSGKSVGDNGLPEIFQKWGFDIYRIMARKHFFETGVTPDSSELTSTDEALRESFQDMRNANVPSSDQEQDGGRTFLGTVINQFKGTLYDAQLYVGFKVEKTGGSSESFSNTTGESQISQSINSKIQGIRSAKFGAMNGNVSDPDSIVQDLVSGFKNTVSTVGGSFVNATGLEGVSSIATGQGYVDIPEVWTGSSFDRSYSFTIPLRSPYGDTVSIMSSIYTPLALLLAAALPRAIGDSAYTSPFLCRAYSRGLFSIPLGIIDSMTITRGENEHGWTYNRLPTAVDVNFTIKDLSPSMYLFVSQSVSQNPIKEITEAASNALFGGDLDTSTFKEYLLTLSGMGLAERTLWYESAKRSAQRMLGIANTTYLSPHYWGYETGNNTALGRFMNKVIPASKVPNN